MSDTPESRRARRAPTAGVTRRSVVRTAAWSAPAIALVAASPAYAASTDASARLVGFEALRYEWPDMQWTPEIEQPWIDARIDYFIESDEPGPSPAVVVHVTFPASWTAGGRSVTVTPGGDFADFGQWVPSIAQVDGVILTTNSVSFTHPGGLHHGEFNEHIDGLSFTAFVAGVDLSDTTDPIALSYEIVDDPDNIWDVAPGSSPAIIHFDGNWVADQ